MLFTSAKTALEGQIWTKTLYICMQDPCERDAHDCFWRRKHTGGIVVLVDTGPEGGVKLWQLPFQSTYAIAEVGDAFIERQHRIVQLCRVIGRTT